MNIVDLLLRRVDEMPDTPAIIDSKDGKSRTHSFKALELETRKVAAVFNKYGLGPGDTVLVFYPMSFELYSTLLAIFRLGMVAMFLDPSAGKEHIEACCAIKAPNALVAAPKAHLLRLISPALRKIPTKFVIGRTIPKTKNFA